MTQNKVVARYKDGRVLKGFTNDFAPNKDHFHLIPPDAATGTKAEPVYVRDLKAIFFVKDFQGNSQYNDKKEFDTGSVFGRKIRVVFKDGELLVGTTQGYQSDRPAFFVTPSDPKSNIVRCFVISASTKEVTFL